MIYVCDLYEMVIILDVWEDEISEGEVNGDCFDNFIIEKVFEVFYFYDGFLLDELFFNYEILDMEFFKEILS